jgi:hypothetical protein
MPLRWLLGLIAIVLLASCGDNLVPGTDARPDSGMLPNPGDTAKEITRFTIDGIDGDVTGVAIALTLPFGTDLTNRVPVIVHTGASVSPASGAAHDFSTPATYTVTAIDGSTQDYTVTVSVAASDAKDITKFTILGVDGAIAGSSIALTLPFGTDLASLTPAIVHTGASVSPASGAAQDFSAPVTYTVTAADASTKSYTVTVGVAPSSAKDITQFTIAGIDGTIIGTSISLTLPFGTSLASLTPTIVHTGASLSPASGVAQDFSAAVTYTVTAADASTKSYTVTVTVAASGAKDITRFTIDGVDGTITGTNITLTLPFGTNLASLTPTIVHTGASVAPASGVPQDFTAPRTYTVTAADTTTKSYTVTVNVAPSSAKDITQFTIDGVDGVITGTAIALTLPFGANPASLTPSITHTGASISPASGVARDFTAPVAYTVTAADGSTKTYTVTVGVAPSSAKDITRFTIDGVDGVIAGTSITLTLPFGTSLASLTPAVIHTGASVSPASGVAQSFVAPVAYTVTAADGSTKTYTVTVGVAPSSSKDITQFTIDGVDGAITGTNIALTLPFGTDVTNLTPSITHTGASISPASGVARSFIAPVEYTVTAADGSTKTYTVAVSIAINSSKDITLFRLFATDGAIAGTNITLVMPAGTNITNIAPEITHTGASISPANLVPQNFSSPVVYTVTAADGSTKAYTVTVTVALGTQKDITSFSILGVDGVISGTAITLLLPFGTNVTNLVPSLTHTGASVSPASGVARNFSSPVTYTVTAQDSSTKTYTVTVGVALDSAKDITQFTIDNVDGDINGTNISLTMPFGTSLTSLTPVITISGASVSPASGVARNFSAPVTYVVTAADGSTKTYTVNVGVAPSSAKDITQFTINTVDADIVGTNISLTLPFGTDVTTLSPTVVHTGTSVSPTSGTAQDFSAPTAYLVTAADGSTKTYIVTVAVAQSSAKDITQFTINGVDGVIAGTTISVALPFGTDVASLAPTVAITGVSVDPPSGASQNFTSPVQYTVTAANGSTQTYTASVTVAQNSSKDITKFTINGVDGAIGADTITLVLPNGTSLASLTPDITISGASVSPASGAAQNFTNPVQYTVTAADGSTKVYTATVTSALSSEKDITSFRILGVDGVVNGSSITLTLPFGTNLTALVPTIVHSGASITPASGVAQNFTTPVQYTVTAQDGSTRVFTVTVSLATGDAKDIIRFTVNGLDAAIATTSPTTGIITLNVPSNTNLSSLSPTVTITGVSVSPVSGAAQNFTNPVNYVVTAANGSTKTYTVTIGTVNGNGTKLITDFIILGVSAQKITNGATSSTIELTLPAGTDLSLQTPTIITNASSVSPPSFFPRNFTSPVTYTVTAANGSTRIYTVTVTTQ